MSRSGFTGDLTTRLDQFGLQSIWSIMLLERRHLKAQFGSERDRLFFILQPPRARNRRSPVVTGGRLRNDSTLTGRWMDREKLRQTFRRLSAECWTRQPTTESSGSNCGSNPRRSVTGRLPVVFGICRPETGNCCSAKANRYLKRRSVRKRRSRP